MTRRISNDHVDPDWVASITREVIARLQNTPTQTAEPEAELTDRNAPDRAAAVSQQLQRRGVTLKGTQVVLTDYPAKETFHQINRGRRAATITTINDVERFADELNPNTWILDMKRLNLPAAANVAAKIARLGNSRP